MQMLLSHCQTPALKYITGIFNPESWAIRIFIFEIKNLQKNAFSPKLDVIYYSQEQIF